MAKFWTCKYGANHGMGERCDCEQEMEIEKELSKRMSEQRQRLPVREDDTGQLAFDLSAKKVGA